MSATNTETIFPAGQAAPAAHDLSEDERRRLGYNLYLGVIASLSDREILDETLDYWYSLLEMYSPPRNVPWPKASNVFIPIAPMQYETLAAQVAQQVFTQRLFIVTGNTEEAASNAHNVEYFYNAKAQQLDLVETFEELKNIGLRDGLGILEVLWRKETREQEILVYEKLVNPDNTPQMDATTGRAKFAPKPYKVTVDVYNDVDMQPVELRDFVMIPSWQTSIEKAHAVGRKLYLDENQLWSMVEGGKEWLDKGTGNFWSEEVEKALMFVGGGGISERPSDQQGSQTVTIGGKIQVGAEEGTTDFSLGQMRGPLEVWRIHSKQYTFDEVTGERSKTPIEYVFWLHHNSQRLLGYNVYEYGHGKRPFIRFAPLPRPLRAYGWSLMERLAPIQAEVNNLYNGRNDIVDLITRPPMYRKANSKIISPQGLAWSPAAMWEVQDPLDVGFVGGSALSQINLAASVNQEDRLVNWASMLSGATPNLAGATNSGRRSATEIDKADASAGVRVGFISQRLRKAMGEALWQWNQLQIQYGPESQNMSGNVLGVPQRMTIDRAMLAMDYIHSVAGSSGQLDQSAKAQQALQTYLLLKDDPDIAGDAVKRYRLKAYLLEAQNNTNMAALIGSEQEAQQRQQAEGQQRQKDAAVQDQLNQLKLQGVHVPDEGQKPHPPQPAGGPPPVKPGQLVAN